MEFAGTEILCLFKQIEVAVAEKLFENTMDNAIYIDVSIAVVESTEKIWSKMRKFCHILHLK